MSQPCTVGFGFCDVHLVKTEEHSLGIGSYGAVYRAKCDQLVCAAKVLHPIFFQTRDPAACRIVQRFEQEIAFLSGLKHPNIVQYLGSRRDPESGLPVLFMELMDESLTSFLERPANPPPLPFHVQISLAHDVTQALSHLHRHEVLHRDLSSNNVLLIGNCRAKVTDFGMAKLLGPDPRLTPTYCPGTSAYMSPEALKDPPAYTTKLDVFSCGVLFIQLITCKFPDPGPRTRTVELNDPCLPSGELLVVVPELERRKNHLDSISPTHPLLRIALECLKDKEELRPTAEQLCSHLIALKESHIYQDSLQLTPEVQIVPTPSARERELEQQLRECEERVSGLTRQVQQLQLQKNEVIHQRNEVIQQRDEIIQQTDVAVQQRDGEIAHLQQQIRVKDEQLQVKERESEQVVAALQQSVEQKDVSLQYKDEVLQTKEREIRELHQRVRVKGTDGGVTTAHLMLEWRDALRTPFPTYGESVAVSGEIAYFCSDSVSDTKILMYDSMTEQWTVLPKCPKDNFSIAVVNGQLTAIGGRLTHFDTATKLLLSLSHQQKWIEQFPPMTFCHNNPAVATTANSLIVAGGWGPDKDKATVEIMGTETLYWSTVASLPYPLYRASATICGGRMYIGGGFRDPGYGSAKSVLVCEVRDLLHSATPQPQKPACGNAHGSKVWRKIAELPVVRYALIALQGQLLVIGGWSEDDCATSEVRQYNATTNTWGVIGHMHMMRRRPFAAVLSDNRVMVVGGYGQNNKHKDHVEIASLIE